MRHCHFLLRFTTSIALAAFAGVSAFSAAESPAIRWGGGAGANPVSQAANLPANLDQAPVLWRLELGSHQYTIPTIDRDRIYLGVNDRGVERPGLSATGGGLLMCIDQRDGSLLWQLASPRFFGGVQAPYHFNQWNCGFCSGPLVDGDRVYVVGPRGEVLCLDRDGQANGNTGPFTDEAAYMGLEDGYTELTATDGDIVWRFDMLKELDVVPHDVCGSTLLLVGDHLYACTSNGQDGSHAVVPRPQAPSLIVLDKHTGRLLATDGERIGERMFHGHWSSPVATVIDGQTRVYFGAGDGFLYAFAPWEAGDPDVANGDEAPGILTRLWATDCNPPEYRFQDGAPMTYSSHNRRIATGPSEVIGVPSVWDGKIYVTIGQSPLHGVGAGALSCIDAATGQLVWRSLELGRSLASPAVTDDGLVFVPDYSGQLHCFDAHTGDPYWSHPLGGGAWSASAFVADGKVYVSTEARSFWVFRAAKEKELMWQGRFKSPTATPVAVDGVLFIPTQTELIAYKVNDQ